MRGNMERVEIIKIKNIDRMHLMGDSSLELDSQTQQAFSLRDLIKVLYIESRCKCCM